MLKNEIKGMKKRAQETEIKATISYLITAGVVEKEEESQKPSQTAVLAKVYPAEGRQSNRRTHSPTHS
jgi:hypothetical protein